MDQVWALRVESFLAFFAAYMAAGSATGQMIDQWRSQRRGGRPKGMAIGKATITISLRSRADYYGRSMDPGLAAELAMRDVVSDKPPEPELVRRRMYDGGVIGLDTPWCRKLEPQLVGGRMPGQITRMERGGWWVKVTRHVLGADGELTLTDDWEVATEVVTYPADCVTIMAPPVKHAKIGDPLELLGTKQLETAMRRMSERFRRAAVPLAAFGRACRSAGLEPEPEPEPQPIGRPADFVYSMGRRRWFGGWRLARRLAWAALLAGVGGAWWWVR